MWGDDDQKVSMVLFFIGIACAVVLLFLMAMHHQHIEENNDLARCDYVAGSYMRQGNGSR